MFTKSKIVRLQFYTSTKESNASQRLSDFFNFLTLKIILLLQKWNLTELTKTFPTSMQPNSKATSEKFNNLLDFNGQELAKHPASKIKNHPLSPVCWLLIQYICHYPQYLEAISSISSMRKFYTMVTNGWMTWVGRNFFV